MMYALPLNATNKFLEIGECVHEKQAVSSVTVDWGVSWSEELVARDLLQNFRDANKSDMNSIKIEIKGTTVCVSAPSEFNLMRLFYLGSEKSESDGDIGQYGEGFKAAAVALLRDFKVTPVVMSGSKLTILSISKESVDGTNLRPLVYDFFEIRNSISGSYLILDNCSKKLIAAMKDGLNNFYWTGHPLIGDQIFSSRALEIYKSTTTSGAGFYQGLKRLDLPKIPLIFVYKNKAKKLDDKISQDRDRHAFNEKIASTYFGLISDKLDLNTIGMILDQMKPLWKNGDGHPLIYRMADSLSKYLMQDEHDFSDRFSEHIGDLSGYYAEVPPHYKYGNEEFIEIGNNFKIEKRIALPSYFVVFGFDSVKTIAKKREEKIVENARSLENARPTPAELQSIDFLSRVAFEFNPVFEKLFSMRGQLVFMVGDSDELLGQMRKGRGYRTTEIFLNRCLFSGDFGEALATYIHELSHVFGHDGDRGFTDALTTMLENMINQSEAIGKLKIVWADMVNIVNAEKNSRILTAKEKIQTLSEIDLRALLSSIPDEILDNFLKTQK